MPPRDKTPDVESRRVREKMFSVKTCASRSCWRRGGESRRDSEDEDEGEEGLRPRTLPDLKRVAREALDGLHIGREMEMDVVFVRSVMWIVSEGRLHRGWTRPSLGTKVKAMRMVLRLDDDDDSGS